MHRFWAVLVSLRHGHILPLWQALRRRLGSQSLAYGLRRDLTLPFEVARAKVPVHVRTATASDEQALRTVGPDMAGQEFYELRSRLLILEAGIGTCYAAVSDDDRTLYVQWLFTASDNDHVQAHFGGAFPVLEPDEALLEGAFTFASSRGMRVMPEAMARISEKATQVGARWVVTFVGTDNQPALKGCERAGFSPYVMRHERWLLFRRTLSFGPLPTPD